MAAPKARIHKSIQVDLGFQSSSENILIAPTGKAVVSLRASRPGKRGVRVVTDVGLGMRWTRSGAQDECADLADGEVVWS
jgi:hypothetical protein